MREGFESDVFRLISVPMTLFFFFLGDELDDEDEAPSDTRFSRVLAWAGSKLTR